MKQNYIRTRTKLKKSRSRVWNLRSHPSQACVSEGSALETWVLPKSCARSSNGIFLIYQSQEHTNCFMIQIWHSCRWYRALNWLSLQTQNSMASTFLKVPLKKNKKSPKKHLTLHLSVIHMGIWEMSDSVAVLQESRLLLFADQASFQATGLPEGGYFLYYQNF